MKIVYTLTDEAPALATYSLLPIVEAFANAGAVNMEAWDISLAGRILALFPDRLSEDQRVEPYMDRLRDLVQSPDANVVKLPNVSAALPQLKLAIEELQASGYDVPSYPDGNDDESRRVRALYDSVRGSAVNPVLRQGNSDRRVPASVKAYTKLHPHWMGEWSSDSKTRVATMAGGDFYANEKSVTMDTDGVYTIQFVHGDGSVEELKSDLDLGEGDILDGTFMDVAQLAAFVRAQVTAAREEDLIFGQHLKATMMKVSDPLIFSYVLAACLPRTMEKYEAVFAAAQISLADGLATLIKRVSALPDSAPILASIEEDLASGPAIAMLNDEQNISVLHTPSDTIVDASMPAMIRNSGKMMRRGGELGDHLALIPDSTYAHVYSAVLADHREHGAIDPRTVGSVSNVGLMASAAEEYGSHDKTFVAPAAGSMQIVDEYGEVLMSHSVNAGDIYRACVTRSEPIRAWLRLAFQRAAEAQVPVTFWLDGDRAHDAELLARLDSYVEGQADLASQYHVLSPELATVQALSRMREGLDSIAATGNVLRDYVTDLFPILELGTSAKMLSIVPLMNGGGLFETGAGGTAPILARQLHTEGYLGWDSLGELLALVPALDLYAKQAHNDRAALLARTLDSATARLLRENITPTRPGGNLDTRISHFYLAVFWAEALASQVEDEDFATTFAAVAAKLNAVANDAEADFGRARLEPVPVKGYFKLDPVSAAAAMRPASGFNAVIDELNR